MHRARIRVSDPKVTVTAQGNLLKVSVGSKLPSAGGGPRGRICEFSGQSRKRMLEMLARVDFRRAGFVAFVTLTYPDGDGPPQASSASRDRAAFCKRICRRHPGASGIWRREWEVRKTGSFTASYYPHFHLLCFNLPFILHTDINRWWSEVLGTTEYVRTEIRGVQSWRQAMGYVAKYMAKTVDAGPRGGTPREPEATVSRSLVNVTYSAGNQGGDAGGSVAEVPSIGRSWGAFNRKRIPWAEQKSVSLAPGPWMEEAKAWASEQYPPIKDYQGYGFSLFSESAQEDFQTLRGIHDKVRAQDGES